MKLYSELTGSGDYLVLLHGMGSAHTAWQLIAPALSQDFTVVSLDLPGHGKSKFDPHQEMDPESLGRLVLRTLDDLGIEKFHIAGNSLGGWIALEIAAASPERTLSLVGFAPAGLWLTPFVSRIPGTAPLRGLARLVKTIAPAVAKVEWAKKIGFASVSPLWKEFSDKLVVDATVAMGSAKGYFPAWDGLLRKRFDKSIAASVPITIIFGDTDNTLPARTSQERSLVPAHVRWIIFPESGHAPMWDHPAECIDEVLRTTGKRA